MPAQSRNSLLRKQGILRQYVIPSLVLIGILLIWDFTKPRMPKTWPEPILDVEPRPNGGVPPWNANETYTQKARDGTRQGTLAALDQAWSSFCEPAGRKKLVTAVGSYIAQRRAQEKSYAERWGKEGDSYIARQWSTANDLRIERLVQESYAAGYLRPADFSPAMLERLAPLLRDTRPAAQDPCKR